MVSRKTTFHNLQISLLISLCFFWTGSEYLTWLYHLMATAPKLNNDLLSEVVGYLFQALGMLIFALCIKKNPSFASHIQIGIVFALDFLLVIPSSTLHNAAAVLLFGFGLNFFHGLVAGIYLTYLARYVSQQHRGKVFGFGYAFGSIGTWLLSLVSSGNFLTSNYVIIAYFLCLLASSATIFTVKKENFSLVSSGKHSHPSSLRTLLVYFGILVVVLSLTKGIGFYFPMADISSGKINLEFSRIFYAVGLIAAGFLNDLNRKYGLVSCLSTLIFPYILLLLQKQSDTSQIIWIIGYTMTGLFTVYRVLLFSDIVKSESIIYLAGLGLLFGRLGDAAGSALGILCNQNQLLLILVSSIFFVITTALTYFISEKIYRASVTSTLLSVSPVLTVTDSNSKAAPDSELAIRDFATFYSLSKREQEVLKLALSDMTNTNISTALYISENTTKFHIRNILNKTGCANRNELRTLFFRKSTLGKQ